MNVSPEIPQNVAKTEPEKKTSGKHIKWMFLVPLLILLGMVAGVILVVKSGFWVRKEKDELFTKGLLPVSVYNEDGTESKWGYTDEKGNMVIEPQFDAADRFADNGLAAVCISDKWGYINTRGERVVDFIFDGAKTFGSGALAPVKSGAVWGYIDESGVNVIPPRFDAAHPFAANGLALVQSAQKYGFIDKKGTAVIPTRYDNAQGFGKNNYAIVQLDGKWGMIDQHGEDIVTPQYDLFFSFSGNNLALVKKDGLFGYIDREGKVAIELQYTAATPFDDSALAVVRDAEGEYHYITGAGKDAFEPTFDDARPFGKSSFAPVFDAQTGLWGYIRRNGDYEIEPKFLEAQSFSAGLALVKDAQGYFFIDRHGKSVFRCPAGYTATSFSEDGYAILYSPEGVAHIVDKEGEPISDAKFSAKSFSALRPADD